MVEGKNTMSLSSNNTRLSYDTSMSHAVLSNCLDTKHTLHIIKLAGERIFGLTLEKFTESTEYPRVIDILPNSAASRAGIMTGWRIVEINGVDCRGFSVRRTAEIFRKLTEATVLFLDQMSYAQKISRDTPELPHDQSISQPLSSITPSNVPMSSTNLQTNVNDVKSCIKDDDIVNTYSVETHRDDIALKTHEQGVSIAVSSVAVSATSCSPKNCTPAVPPPAGIVSSTSTTSQPKSTSYVSPETHSIHPMQATAIQSELKSCNNTHVPLVAAPNKSQESALQPVTTQTLPEVSSSTLPPSYSSQPKPGQSVVPSLKPVSKVTNTQSLVIDGAASYTTLEMNSDELQSDVSRQQSGGKKRSRAGNSPMSQPTPKCILMTQEVLRNSLLSLTNDGEVKKNDNDTKTAAPRSVHDARGNEMDDDTHDKSSVVPPSDGIAAHTPESRVNVPVSSAVVSATSYFSDPHTSSTSTAPQPTSTSYVSSVVPQQVCSLDTSQPIPPVQDFTKESLLPQSEICRQQSGGNKRSQAGNSISSPDSLPIPVKKRRLPNKSVIEKRCPQRGQLERIEYDEDEEFVEDGDGSCSSDSSSGIENDPSDNEDHNDTPSDNEDEDVEEIPPPPVPSRSRRESSRQRRSLTVNRLIRMGFKQEDAEASVLHNGNDLDKCMMWIVKRMEEKQFLHDLNQASVESEKSKQMEAKQLKKQENELLKHCQVFTTMFPTSYILSDEAQAPQLKSMLLSTIGTIGVDAMVRTLLTKLLSLEADSIKWYKNAAKCYMLKLAERLEQAITSHDVAICCVSATSTNMCSFVSTLKAEEAALSRALFFIEDNAGGVPLVFLKADESMQFSLDGDGFEVLDLSQT